MVGFVLVRIAYLLFGTMALYFRNLRICLKRMISNGRCFTGSKSLTQKAENEDTTYSAKAEKERNINLDESGRMCAWQIHSYGTIDELQFTKTARSPSLTSPNEVLIKVLASSVNSIDVMMLSGYGASILNLLRQVNEGSLIPELEFPLILGRDFCGEIIAKGNGVGSELNVGDIVYGVIPAHQQGCHAQNVLINKNFVRRKPDGVSIEEAASVLYVGMTAWSALKLAGDLWILPSDKKKVLVIGASGGVGSVAVQLLKSWNAEVVATCSAGAIPLVKSLNPDHVVDYTKPESMQELSHLGKYDIILDAAGIPEADVTHYVTLLKDWSLSKFITLRSPLLKNVDTFGFISGMLHNAKDFIVSNFTSGAVTRGSSIRWGLFMPLPNGIDEIHHLLTMKQIKPVIHKKFNFSELPLAYKEVKSGHLRGKVVITVP